MNRKLQRLNIQAMKEAGKMPSEMAAAAMSSIHEGAKLFEYGQGVFVTAAMMTEIRKDPHFPGEATRPEVAKGNPTLTDIADHLDRLERLIKHTFDGHVLIDGRFRKITP